MKTPGVWILGDLADDDRSHGMGIVVEYAGQHGKPLWAKPKPFHWDYARFGKPNTTSTDAKFDQQIDLVFAKNNAALNGFNQWTINGAAFDMEKSAPAFHLIQEAAIACACVTPAMTSTPSISIATVLN